MIVVWGWLQWIVTRNIDYEKNQKKLIKIYGTLENTTSNPPQPGVTSLLKFGFFKKVIFLMMCNLVSTIHLVSMCMKLIYVVVLWIFMLVQIIESSPLGNFYLWNRIAFNLGWPLLTTNETFYNHIKTWSAGPLGMSISTILFH